jgi:putative ABC transport system permease protein
MKLLLAYTLRNLLARRLTTLLTAGGMALVVFAFAAIIMLAEGLQRTLVESGSPQNVVIIRRASNSEVQSGVDRDQAAIVESGPEVAIDARGRRLLAKELVVLINLKKRGSDSPSNVLIRGISATSLALRPQVRLVVGRMPRSGSSEIMVGRGVAQRFQNAGYGEVLRFAMRSWAVTGVFDAGNTSFSSEIWGDVDQLMQAFRRPVYSSVIFRLRDSSAFETLRQRIDGDPRLTLDAKRETTYYRDQSEFMAKFLRILGTSLTIVFSIGAIVGAMITMYSAVANRTSEIGTLRAIGFQRRAILTAFMVESVLLGMMGGVAGLIPASFLQLFTVSTTNFQTFSELAFKFSLSTSIVGKGFGFAVVMGLLGGLLPAVRASRMSIVESLRAV